MFFFCSTSVDKISSLTQETGAQAMRVDITDPEQVRAGVAEAARLLGISVNEIQENREKYARVLAQKTNSVTVLKGHNTIITSPTCEERFCPYGNSGMGKGGSGDILAGMITSFVTQGLRLFDAAVLGVTLHALAGDAAAEKFGQNSMLPTDLINALPEVFKKYI